MNTPSAYCDPKAMAVALGRWCLGIILLVAGTGKLSMGVGTFAKFMTGMFEKTWLPGPLLAAYSHALPFAEVILGALLLLGLLRNGTLFVAGLLFLSLTFGQIVLATSGRQESGSVMFQNMVFTFFAAGLLFLHEFDRWTIRSPKVDPAG